MAVLPAGSAVPRFTLGTAEGGKFTQDAIAGERTLLVFYPAAFSPVCTDQLQLLDEVSDDLAAKGVSIVAVSCDASPSQVAFAEKLGVGIRQLSDFEPKGDASRAFGVYFTPAGISTRALVITADDGTIAWSWEGEHPGVLPPVSLILDAIAELGW
ncbi:MAG: redoxin domain-containing protein [Solirubrobacteraceae bacterium]|nr:redoxin domain-containing protein [Solirubrobacteraceae bacterium]